jgi:hypothetical protein
MRFKPTGKLIITDTVIGALKLDKTQEAEMRKFVPQLVGAIEQAYVESGFEKHDLAVALAGLLITCHEIDTGTFNLEDSSPAQKEVEKKRLQAAANQIRRAVGAKQSTYELCTFQIGYMAVVWQQAGEDEEKKAAAKQLARQLLTTIFNIDPDGFLLNKDGTLGPKPGYKPARKSSDPSAVPTDDPPLATPLPAVSDTPKGPAPLEPPAGWSVAAGQGGFVWPSALVATDKEGFFLKHRAGVQAILSGLVAADKKAAIGVDRGINIARLPTEYPKWLKPGGALQPGIYVGNETYGDELRAKLRLYLFPSGEYQLYRGDGTLLSDHPTVNYKYNPRTGLLDMDWGTLHHLSNDKFDPDDDMCLVGKDAQGKPVVYARSDRGFHYSTTILRYVGPTDKPSPADEKAAKAAADPAGSR